MSVDVLLGLQWGDEGKGKIVDFLAHNYHVVARFQGGPNAGHTLYYEGKKVVLHHIPSGIFHQNLLNFIGNGVVIDPVTLQAEIDKIKAVGVNPIGRLYIARKAQLILPTHKMLDAASEAAKGKAKIGSTLRGIGPTYSDKIGRNGLRVGDIERTDFRTRYENLKAKHEGLLKKYYDFEYDLSELEEKWFESIEKLKNLQIVDGEYFINEQIEDGKKVLAEGAQGSMLDIDFGTYPFVTSSNTITAGVCNGLGIAPSLIKEVIGITKAYCTRVGSGPFPTELHGEMGEKIRQEGGEFGATTGRPRRCGWIDLPALKYAIMLSGVTQVVMTKVDILSVLPQIEACTHYKYDDMTTKKLPYDLENASLKVIYKQFEGWQCDLSDMRYFEDLPDVLQNYIHFVEQYLGCDISILSTGGERNQLVHKKVGASLIA